jgi:glycerophosphoryl diester phosphodiesterase
VLELDVHLSSDDDVLVIHDETVDRTTNKQGRVDSMPTSRLRELDIPTLDEVLELVKGRAVVLIEIKASRPTAGLTCRTCAIYRSIAKKVASIISSHNAAEWTIVQSFHIRYLQQIHDANPAITCHALAIMHTETIACQCLHWNLDGMHWNRISLTSLREMGISALNVSKWCASRSFIQQVHDHNMEVYVWTVDDEVTMEKLLDWGADGIITNDPGLCLATKTAYYKKTGGE